MKFIDEFDIEFVDNCDSDYVEIIQSGFSRKYCGNNVKMNVIPVLPLETNKPEPYLEPDIHELTVNFQSDESEYGIGFEIQFECSSWSGWKFPDHSCKSETKFNKTRENSNSQKQNQQTISATCSGRYNTL